MQYAQNQRLSSNLTFLTLLTSIFIVFAFPRVAFSYSVPKDVEEKIEQRIQSMSVRELYGQKFMIGIPWLYKNDSDYEIDVSRKILKELLLEYGIGSFVLSDINFRDWMSYSDNLSDKTQWKVSAENIIRQIQETRQLMTNQKMLIPPLFAADYEGGLVQHFRGDGLVSQTPSPMNFTATGDLGDVKKFGELTGKLYKTLGLTTNFAPLVDVNSETTLNVIGTRSFSSDPFTVISMASSFADGMQQEGIAPVIKHWPGLGNTPDMSGGWDVNIDIHEYTKPLTFNGSLRQYFPIYKHLLQQPQFNSSGIMTAHVAVDSYRQICQKDLNLVGFCRHIIEDGIRSESKGLGANEHVVISDDVAYLKATRTQFKNIPKALNEVFKSGHDLIIVGSLTPNYSVNTFDCDGHYHPLDCKFPQKGEIPWLEGLKGFFEMKEKQEEVDEELVASVRRILRWKYVTYRDLMGESLADAQWLDPSFDYQISESAGLEDIKQEFVDLSKKVFKDSVVIIHPAGYDAKSLSAELSVGSSKIYCIGPTFAVNDLRKSLGEGLSEDDVSCKDLSYHPSQIKDQHFEEKNIDDILTGINEQDPDLVVFGLVNKQKHINVFVDVYNQLREEANSMTAAMKPRKVLLVAFNSPGVIEEIHKRLTITDDLYILTTFSNSGESNRRVVTSLLEGKDIQSIEHLPISLKGYHGWVNVLQNTWLGKEFQETVKDIEKNPTGAGGVDYRVPGTEGATHPNYFKYGKWISAGIGFVAAFVLMFYINGIGIGYSILCPVLGAYIFLTINPQQMAAVNPESLKSIELAGYTISLDDLWPWIGTVTCALIIFLVFSAFSIIIQTVKRLMHGDVQQPPAGT